MSPCLKERVWGKEYPSGLRAKTTFVGAYHVTFRMSFFGLRKVMWDDPYHTTGQSESVSERESMKKTN